jgi:hypothetical protein
MMEFAICRAKNWKNPLTPYILDMPLEVWTSVGKRGSLDVNFNSTSGVFAFSRPPGTSSLMQSWELLLQQVETDSKSHGDVSAILGRKLGQTLLEKTFHRKIQSRKIFVHRELYEGILSKADEALQKVSLFLPSHPTPRYPCTLFVCKLLHSSRMLP